jgi:hypothetical protein
MDEKKMTEAAVLALKVGLNPGAEAMGIGPGRHVVALQHSPKYRDGGIILRGVRQEDGHYHAVTSLIPQYTYEVRRSNRLAFPLCTAFSVSGSSPKAFTSATG